LTAADTLNDRVLPFFVAEGVPLLRVLTDRGSEYVGNLEQHEYELYLALENIDHSKTRVKSPQTNGICERFHKTVLNEFYRVAFRKKLYSSLDELQADLDLWLAHYNEERRTLAGTVTARRRCRRGATRSRLLKRRCRSVNISRWSFTTTTSQLSHKS
jgi:transposase InsO family protein